MKELWLDPSSEEVMLSHRVTQSREATIVELEVRLIQDDFPDNDEIISVKGTAKLEPGDKFDPEIGLKLALSRALETAARKLAKRGNGLVKQAEDNAAHRQAIRDKEIAESIKKSKNSTKLKAAVRNGLVGATHLTNGG